MNWLSTRISSLNTTNLKVFIALLLVIMTGGVYLGLAVARVALMAAGYDVPEEIWKPDIEWIGLLVAMLADSTAHFIGKRATHAEYIQAKNGNGKPKESTSQVSQRREAGAFDGTEPV